MNETDFKLLVRVLLAGFFCYAGYLHFKIPEPFVRIVPPFLPWPYGMVWLSGLFEILGGLGILIPSVQFIAGWGLVALLLAVYPANIYMALSGVKIFGFPKERWMAWARLPLQFVLIYAVIWACDLGY